MKIILFLLISLIVTINGRAVNCERNPMVLSVVDTETIDCHDADLCRIDCEENLFLEINLDDKTIPLQTKDAYLATCTWELERNEILTNVTLHKPEGRGQIISQYIAKFSRPYVKKLPKPPVLQLHTGRGGLAHYDQVRGIIRNHPHSNKPVPTVLTMRDWIDYLIYVSNHYTFFKDLCKDNSLKDAQNQLKKKLLDDASQGLYPKYYITDRPKIEKFVKMALKKILTKFEEVYNDPENVCLCDNIIKRIQNPKEKRRLKRVINKLCDTRQTLEFQKFHEFFQKN